MDLEKMLKAQAVETESRNAGVEKLQKFLDRALTESGLNNPQVFFEMLRTISANELLKVLERINGILTEVPIHRRESLTHESGVQNEFFFNSAVELVPPTTEVRKRLLAETIANLQAQLDGMLPDDLNNGENLENTSEVVARTLFNAIIYLHPFGDGNGRTARTMYYVLSPNITNKSVTALATRLTERPGSLREYHQLLNQSTLEGMLYDHNIRWVLSDPPNLPIFDTDNPTRGLDADHIQFIAAYDVMTEEERGQYVTAEENGLIIRQEKLPPEITAKINSRMNAVREEFVDCILEFSAYPEKWPYWLQEPFTKAFSRDDNPAAKAGT